MTHYVYALRDPETLAVYYVGQSWNPERRLAAHQWPSSSSLAMWRWVESLRARGLKPLMEILEMCAGFQEADVAEQRLIHEHLMQGAPLVNEDHRNFQLHRVWYEARAHYSPPPVASELLSSARERLPTRPLHWSVRPKRLACACGSQPMLGYLDADMTLFVCAICREPAP